MSGNWLFLMLVFMTCVSGLRINGSRILYTKAGIWLTPPHFLDVREFRVSDTSEFDTSDSSNINLGDIWLLMLTSILDERLVSTFVLAVLFRLVPMVEK